MRSFPRPDFIRHSSFLDRRKFEKEIEEIELRRPRDWPAVPSALFDSLVVFRFSGDFLSAKV